MSNKTLTMMAVGDICMDPPAEPLFDLARDTLKSADVLIGQSEIPFTLRGITPHVNLTPPLSSNDVLIDMKLDGAKSPAARKSSAKVVTRGIDCDPKSISALVDVGFDVMHLAGNHTFDAGAPGVEDTLNGLHKAGIATIGAGMDLDEARRPAIIEKEGTRFGFLSYNCLGPIGSWAAPEKPGCA